MVAYCFTANLPVSLPPSQEGLISSLLLDIGSRPSLLFGKCDLLAEYYKGMETLMRNGAGCWRGTAPPDPQNQLLALCLQHSVIR